MADLNEDVEYLYKILVVGDLGCGKTSIIHRYVSNIFSNKYRATIGVDFALKVLQWSDNVSIRLQLWDIAGQERFGHMTRVYYKEAVGALTVFDVTRQGTFEAVQKWKQDLDNNLSTPERQLPVILCANKCDLAKEPLDKEKMDAYCAEHHFIGWFETSAKEDIGLKKAFNFLVGHIIAHDPDVQERQDGTVKLGAPGNAKSGGGAKQDCAC